MTRTQYYTAASIDGFIADADNSLDWLFEVDDDPGRSPFAAFFAEVGAFVMGATTYEWVVDHDSLLDHPERWASYYGSTPAWVLTHRDLRVVPDADVRFVAGDLGEVHASMVEAAGGKNIWVVGGGDVAGQFADLGLLDEIIVGVAPVTLGSGAPLLPRPLTSGRLSLESVERRGEFAYLTYGVAAASGGVPFDR